MAKTAKDRQRAGNSNWTPKVAPWRVTILAKIGDFGEIVRGECPRRTFAALFWRICNSVLYYLTVIE